MSDILGISSSGVATYQRALSVVSNNIANAATEGYTRQDVTLEANPAQSAGSIYLGTGVYFSSIKRQYDAFVESNLRNSNSDLQSQKPVVDYTNRIVDVMGGETSSLTSALGQFFSSARSLSADPASTVMRGSFLRDADGLAARFNQLSSQLDLVDSETRDAVKSSVNQINTLAGQLAQVNQQLGKTADVKNQPAELLDQRDNLLSQLSQFSKVNTRFSDSGVVTVSMGASISQEVIVDGKNTTRLEVNFDAASPEKFSLVLDPYGNPRPLTGVNSGQLAGLIAFREQVLGSTRDAIDTLANTVATEVNKIHAAGVDGYGQRGGPLFAIDPAALHASASIHVATQDPLKVSAAAAFRVVENANNAGTEDATVRFDTPSYAGTADLDKVLVNNASVAAAQSLTLSATPGAAALATVPAGMKDVTVYLDTLSAGQQLQMVTRDGRHLAGQALTGDQKTRLLTPNNGLEVGASYSTDYLNAPSDAGFKGMKVFYGARAQAADVQQFDNNGIALPPTQQAAVLLGTSMATGWSGLPAAPDGKPVDYFNLNGIPLGALTPSDGVSVHANDVAQWLNAAGVAGVSARASNDIRTEASQLKLKEHLSLNGVDMDYPTGGYASAQDLANAVNAKKATTGVMASVGAHGELTLSNVPGQEGRSIQVGGFMSSTPNALGVSGGLFEGQVSLTRTDGDNRPIELGIGSQGDAATLSKMGFRTQAHISGTVSDDVLVFVTGAGTAKVAASFNGQASDPVERLRNTPMTLKFTSPSHFVLTDQTTNTVVAERDFDPNDPSGNIQYQGLTIHFSNTPKTGDTFTIDGNHDGSGDNLNMVELIGLESKSIAGGKTLETAYIDHVNDMGNVSRQASIVQSSLTVVHDQAVASRDKVSGVSLDEEATNLIRFQQAYQASAKALQTATQLFDTMLQIR